MSTWLRGPQVRCPHCGLVGALAFTDGREVWLAYSPEQLLAFRAETAAQGGHVQLVTPERLQPTRKKTKHGRTSREPNDYREPAWCRDRSHAFVLADDDRSAIAAGTAPRNVQGRKSPDWQ